MKKRAETVRDQLQKGLNTLVAGLFCLMIVLTFLFRSEGKEAQGYQMIQEIQQSLISVPAQQSSFVHEHRLLHVIGDIQTNDVLHDDLYGLVVTGAVKLKRTVAMYQRHEHIDQTIKNQTVYYYTKERSQTPIDSSQFHEPGYINPRFPSEKNHFEVVAQEVTIGDYNIGQELIGGMNNYESLLLGSKTISNITGSDQRTIQDNAVIQKTAITGSQTGFDIGDVRVSFHIVPLGKYTVIGEQDTMMNKQNMSTLVPHKTHISGEIFFVKKGEVAPSDIFAEFRQIPILQTWGIRLGGVLIIFLTIMMVLQPSKIIMEQYVSDAAQINKIQQLIAITISVAISLMINALARLFVKPRLTGVLLVIAGALILSLSKRKYLMKNILHFN